jgi:hypothetical protein
VPIAESLFLAAYSAKIEDEAAAEAEEYDWGERRLL